MSGIKFTLNKKKKKLKKSNILQETTPQQEEKVEIETYNKSPKKPKLIINPDKISHKITPLNYGLTTFTKTTPTSTTKISTVEIEEDSDEEYKKIPIDQFGIGFLRGLGYEDDDDEEEEEEEEEVVEDKSVEHRQRGVTLGIGAEPVDLDLVKELMKGTPELPLIKKRKVNSSTENE